MSVTFANIRRSMERERYRAQPPIPANAEDATNMLEENPTLG